MKTSDKIAGVISVIGIIATIFYLLRTKLFFTVDKDILYFLGILILISFAYIVLHYLTIGIILRRRIAAFKELSHKYSLKHLFVKNIIFIPYSKLNTLNGTINGHTIEVTDDSFMPEMGEIVETNILYQISPMYVPRKSINMNTKIFVDGKDVTPNYSQKWVFYRSPFMKVEEIEDILAKLK